MRGVKQCRGQGGLGFEEVLLRAWPVLNEAFIDGQCKDKESDPRNSHAAGRSVDRHYLQ